MDNLTLQYEICIRHIVKKHPLGLPSALPYHCGQQPKVSNLKELNYDIRLNKWLVNCSNCSMLHKMFQEHFRFYKNIKCHPWLKLNPCFKGHTHISIVTLKGVFRAFPSSCGLISLMNLAY